MSDKPQQPHTPAGPPADGKKNKPRKGRASPRIQGLFNGIETEPSVEFPGKAAAPPAPSPETPSTPLHTPPGEREQGSSAVAAPPPAAPASPDAPPAAPTPAAPPASAPPAASSSLHTLETPPAPQSPPAAPIFSLATQPPPDISTYTWESLRSGRPMVSAPHADQPARLTYARPIETTSMNVETQTALPAVLLEVMADDPQRIWSEDELLLVEQVTDQLTLALENARLFEESRLRSEQLAILNEMSRNLSAQLNIQDVLETVHRYTSLLLDASNLYIAMYDPETQEVRFPLAFEDNQRTQWRSRPLSNGLTEYILKHGQPVLIRDNVREYIRLHLGIEVYGREALSWLGVPLGYANQIVGVMAVQSFTQTAAYDENQRDLMVAIAGQAAVALQNARLYTEERRRRQIADALSSIARAVSATLEVQQIAGQTLELLGRLVPYTHASLRLVSGRRQEIIAHRDAAPDDSNQEIEDTPAMAIPGDLLDPIIEQGQDALEINTHTNPAAAPLLEVGVQSWMAVPLLAREQVVGLIEVGHSHPDEFNLVSLDLLRTVAAQIAVAIQNASLFVETQTARDALQINVRYQENLARAVAALTERGITALREVLETLGQAAQSDRAAFMETQVDPDGPFWRLAAEWRAPGVAPQPDIAPSTLNPALQHIPAEAVAPWAEQLRTAGFCVVQVDELAPEDRSMFAQLGAVSALLISVAGRYETPSCLVFTQQSGQRDWMVDEIAALQTAASALSSTIAREDLFSQVQANLAETEAQYQASARLNSAGGYDEILEVLRQYTVLGHLNTANVVINLFDRPWTAGQPPEWLLPIARWTSRSADAGLAERLPLTAWPGAVALLDGDRPTVVADVESDSRLDAQVRQTYLETMGARSLLMAPLNVAGRWIGHIIAVYRRTAAFPEQEVRRLTSLSGQAAVAIEGLRLLEETRRRNEELATINQITNAVSGTLELDQVLAEILTRVLNVVGYDAGLVSISDPQTNLLTLAVQQNLPESMALHLQQDGMAGTACNIVFEAGQMLYVPDISRISDEMQTQFASFGSLAESLAPGRIKGFNSYLGVPLISKGVELGTVCLFNHSPQSVAPSRLALMEAIGQQVGVVIENARLFQSTQRSLSETEMLYQASAELNAVQSYDDILATLRKYSILGDVDHSVSLDLFDHPWMSAGASVSGDAPDKATQMARWLTPALADPQNNRPEQTAYLLREFPPVRSLMRPNAVAAVRDMANDPRLDPATQTFYQAMGRPAPFKVRGVILAPLLVGSQWVGFIHAVYMHPADWQESDMRRLEVLAGQAAVAAQNLNQFRQIQERAHYEYLTREIGSQAGSSIDRDLILRTIARSLGQAINASHVIVQLHRDQLGYVYDRETEQYLRLDDANAQPLLEMCTQTTHRGDALRAGVKRMGPLPEAEMHRHGAGTSHIFAPITLRGELTGAVDVFDLTGQAYWSDNDLTLVQTISSQVALSLDNARLFQETQAALSETEALYQGGSELNAVRSYNDILEALRKYSILGQADRLLSIYLFNRPWKAENSGLQPLSRLKTDLPEWITPIAFWSPLPDERLRRRYSPRSYPAARLLSPTDPTFIEDLSQEHQVEVEARRLFTEEYGARSMVFAPLNVGGSWIGFINAAYSEPAQCDDADLRRLMALASQAAVAVQNLNSIELAEQRAQEAGRRSQELAQINRIVTSVSASLDLQSSLDIVTREIAVSLNVFTGIALLDSNRNLLTVVTNASPYPDTPNTVGLEIPLENNPSSQTVIETRRSLIVEDPQHAEITSGLHEVMRQLDVRGLIIIPLISGAEVIGTVALESLAETRTFGQDELRLAETIVFQAAAAIQNARLFEQTQQVLAETDALYQAGARFQVAKNYNDILDALRSYTALNRQVQAVYLDLYDEPWDDENTPLGTSLIAQWAAHANAASTPPVSAGSARRLIPTAPNVVNTLTCNQVTVWNQPEDLRQAAGSGFSSLYPGILQAQTAVITPLLVGGQNIGHVAALYPETTTLSDDDVRRLMALAGQAAVAVQNLRLLEESQRRARQLQTAAEIARDTSGALATQTLLQRTVNLLCERFGYYHATVFLLDESGTEATVRESTGLAGEEMKRAGHRLTVGGSSVIGQVTQLGVPMVVNDVTSEEAGAIHRPNPLLPFTRAELGLPLKTGNRVIGALDVQSTRPNAFSEDDVTVLQILADQIAVAIDNARAYEISQKAADDLREADRLKTQFLANMSHELRTPLNSIIGFSRVILKGIDGPVTDLQTQDLSAIYNSGQHLLGLINDVLDLSKIEAGKMELSFEEDVNLGEIIKSVMSTTLGLIKDKPIRLKSVIAPDLPLLSLDSMKIRQVMINLLSNAAKFTEEGSITIEAEQQPDREGRGEVVVRVVDTGPGIAPQDQLKLFQPFSQVDGSLTRKTGGSGLGLSIIHHLVRMHGGRIGLYSEVGKGTTFYFTLPVERPKQINQEDANQPEMPDLAENGLPAAPRSAAADGAPVSLTDEQPGAAPPENLSPPIAPSGEPPENAAADKPLIAPEQAAQEPTASARARPSRPPKVIPLPASMDHAPTSPHQAEAPDRPPAPAAPSASLEEQPLIPGMVLAIDRDPQIVEMYRRYLTPYHFTVISLTDLEQAATVARGIQPVVITLDVNMQMTAGAADRPKRATGGIALPEQESVIDGWKVLEWLKADAATRNIPLIVCTIAADSERAFRMGADDFLLKPILEDDLIQAIKRLRK